MDVEFVEEVKNDIESLKAIQAEYPDVFGGSKRDLRFILLCLYHKAIEKHDGPRKVMPETLEPGRAKYYDPALRLSHDEVKQFMGKNLELHHDGQILDARFIGHKIINGRALALALCKAETPQKAAIADRIGPDKEFKGVSISASWEIAKDRSVTKDAKAGNVALTPDPFYPTYVYFAASSEAVERGMHF